MRAKVERARNTFNVVHFSAKSPGLGEAMTQRYAIEDPDQARRYLADSTLGPRLRQV
jgi:uncharacterized protein (DUF1810 family)